MKKLNKAQYLTRTAMLLAVAVVFQNLRMLPILASSTPQSLFVIGTLVNLVLVISVDFAGAWAAMFIGVCTPVIAWMQGHLAFEIMIPIVVAGNIVFSTLYFYIKDKNKYLGIIGGAIVKFVIFILTMPALISIFLFDKPEKVQSLIQYNFSWPQLVTALIGGFLAIIISSSVKLKINGEKSGENVE